MSDIIDLAQLRAARTRIAPHVVQTPLLRAPLLDRLAGAHLFIKAEPLQVTGSFKARGAFSRMTLLTEEERRRGVIAYSSGNHAQAVAHAAATLGCRATIVMPADAPRLKRDNTRAYGATVVTYDRFGESREAIGARLAAETGAIIVPPYDDPAVMAGQGTVGLEMVEQAAAMDVQLDVLLCCCGGGGLIAGIATAMAALSPATRVYAVEPEGYDDTRRSLEAGVPVANAPGPMSICDAIVTPAPGKLTFPVNRRLLAGAMAVSDHEALQAVAAAARWLKLVVEPGGAVALAAALSGRLDLRGRTVGVVCSGGNLDPEILTRALSLTSPPAGEG